MQNYLLPVALLGLTLLASPPLYASSAEAKAAAREEGCTVTAITALTQQTGEHPYILYQATCLLPAAASDAAKKANGTLQVRCDDTLCTVVKRGLE